MFRVSVVVAAAALLVSSCSSSDHPEAQPSDSASDGSLVAPLDVAWRATFTGGAFGDFDDSRGDALWVGGTTVSVVTHAVTTYDAATGKRRSVVHLPAGHVCAVSRQVNRDGIGAVALGRGCRTVVAVDTEAGKIAGRWETDRLLYLQDVSVGDHVVVAADEDAGAYRFDLRSGGELPRLGPGSAASDGHLVVLGTGSTAHQTFEVHDQDSGDLVAQVSGGSNVDVLDILADDPLLVAASSNQAGSYVMDLTARTARASGRKIQNSYPNLGGYEQLDHRLFVQYGDAPVVDAWNTTTHRLTSFAVLGSAESLVGVHDGRLITVETTGSGSVVRALDPDAPDGPLVLGTARDGTETLLLSTISADVAGDLLVAVSDHDLVALDLPDDGVSQADLDVAAGLDSGDYTSADAGDLCTGLRPATLRDLGLRPTGRGYPADCKFSDPDTTAYLTISAFASVPGDGLSAREVAHNTFASTVDASGTNNLPGLAPLPSVGEEAAWGTSRSNGSGLVVRSANVTIVVQGTNLAPPRGTTLQEALAAAGKDLVAELRRRGPIA
jgi:hypothetical protein